MSQSLGRNLHKMYVNKMSGVVKSALEESQQQELSAYAMSSLFRAYKKLENIENPTAHQLSLKMNIGEVMDLD